LFCRGEAQEFGKALTNEIRVAAWQLHFNLYRMKAIAESSWIKFQEAA